MSAPATLRTTDRYEVALEAATEQDKTIPDAKDNGRVAEDSDEQNDITMETFNSNHSGVMPYSEPVYSESSARKGAVTFEDLSRIGGEPGLPSRQNKQTAPVDTANDATSDQIYADGLYADTAEIYGQDGEMLPFAEMVRARKAQDILRHYSDRKAKAVIIEAEGDDYETEPGMHNLSDDTDVDEVDMEVFTEGVDDVESVIEALAYLNLHDDTIDPELQIDRLWAALAQDNPPEIRLQAIYLLADIDSELIEEFLDDPEDLIRYEAERLVGILPED
jgi:hypothetical protein